MKDLIHRFAAKGDVGGVAAELAKGIAIDSTPPIRRRETPLLAAINSPEAGVDMLRFLVAQGADVNRPSLVRSQTPLQAAICSGDLEKVRCLVDLGANLQDISDAGYDPLMNAVFASGFARKGGMLAIIDYLLTMGVITFPVSTYGESALNRASLYGRFDVVQRLLEAGAPVNHLGWTPLMHAVALGDLQDVEKAMAQGGHDLEARDPCGRTAWLLSVQAGDVAKARLLLAAGADSLLVDRGQRSALMLALPDQATMLKWLLAEGFDPEVRDYFGDTTVISAAKLGATESVDILLQAGADPFALNDSKRTAIHEASNLEIVRLLVAYGADIAQINDRMRRQLLGFRDEYLNVGVADYHQDKTRRFGRSNPEKMDVAFWRDMIRSGRGAWWARTTYEDEPTQGGDPVWCYERFGRSQTFLPDGRIIEIGGEHEDFYDPDFCIYNDVVVHVGDGTFTIYGYPEALFPPTDFHTATLVGNYIYILGSLGYVGSRRFGEMPVFRLDCNTLTMERLITYGDMPGWIHGHHTAYRAEAHCLVVTGGDMHEWVDGQEVCRENTDEFRFDLVSLHWAVL